MGTEPIRAVVFDLDGVLTDTAEFHYRAWKALADEEGLAFDREMNEQLRGISRRASIAIILADRKVDEGEVEAMMARKNALYLASLEQMGPDDTLPGAIEALEAARREGLRVALASSSRNARMVLDKLQLADRFDVIVDGNSVEHAKPAPDLFLRAAEDLQVSPCACLVVEDAASGVDAAVAAGMWVIGVGPADRVGHAHLRVDDTADLDLPGALRRINERQDEPARDGHQRGDY